ncbi:LysR family transcriptional regulator [Microbacterium sp. A93]|uniref:LysR family transcriptional regulator n=1 Tax=Microbacterium sp. A93 TaxID=3450716 RepID=UPI003F42537F
MSKPEAEHRDLDLDLRTLRIVRALTETGSISGAARSLGLSQPAVSQHIQRSESRLGMQIIVRSGRSIALSEAGAKLSDISGDILATVDSCLAQLRGLADLRAGNIALSGFSSASSTIVPPVLTALRRIAPGLTVTYTEAEPGDALAGIADGTIDLAVVCNYPLDPLDPVLLASHRIKTIDQFVDPIYGIFPRDHPLASEDVVELADMEDDEWIAGCPRCRAHVVHASRAVGFEPRVTMETDNFSAVLSLVASGLGVSALPKLAIASAVVPRGVAIKRINPSESRTISLAFSEDATAIPAVRAVLSAFTSMDASRWRLTESSGRSSLFLRNRDRLDGHRV